MSKKWTERTYSIYDATVGASHGLDRFCPMPNDPTLVEALLLSARECFKARQQCRGWDLVDEACRGDRGSK